LEVRMKVLRDSRRRRWLAAGAFVALVAAIVVAVSGVATAGQHAVTSQAAPIADPNYIYGQLFDMSYNDVYRVSGADGPPTQPGSAWNLPPTVNGWQEFFAHWKQQLTETKAMKNPAKSAAVPHH